MKYRRLQKEDLQSIREVASESWKHPYRNIFDDSYNKEWVEANYSSETLRSILSDSDIGKAFSMWPKTKSHGWELLRIYLLSDYMGTGIGTKLI